MLGVSPHIGGLGRIFCEDFGVIMMTAVLARPCSVFNNGDQDKEMVCVFPSTFTEKLSEFIQVWQPNMHVNCGIAVLPLSALNDGLAKWTEWADDVLWVDDQRVKTETFQLLANSEASVLLEILLGDNQMDKM